MYTSPPSLANVPEEDQFSLHDWEVRNIKFRSIVLLQSLCEIIEDPLKVYGRLSKFLSIFLVLVYLEESYLLYKQVYGPEFMFKSLNKVEFANKV